MMLHARHRSSIMARDYAPTLPWLFHLGDYYRHLRACQPHEKVNVTLYSMTCRHATIIDAFAIGGRKHYSGFCAKSRFRLPYGIRLRGGRELRAHWHRRGDGFENMVIVGNELPLRSHGRLLVDWPTVTTAKSPTLCYFSLASTTHWY